MAKRITYGMAVAIAFTSGGKLVISILSNIVWKSGNVVNPNAANIPAITRASKNSGIILY